MTTLLLLSFSAMCMAGAVFMTIAGIDIIIDIRHRIAERIATNRRLRQEELARRRVRWDHALKHAIPEPPPARSVAKKTAKKTAIKKP